MKNKETLSILAMIFTVIAWGISFISIKVVVSVLPPMTFTFVRFSLTSIVLFIILKIREPKTRLEKKDLLNMAISALLGISIYFYFENNGVKLTTASTASIIISTLPVFTVAADAVIYGYKLNLSKIMGIMLSLVGVYFVVGASVKDISGSGFGFLFMFGAVISWVAYSFVTKPLTKKYSELAIVTYQAIFATISLLPFLFIEHTNWHEISMSVVLNIAFLGIVCSAISNWLYVFAMQGIGVSASSLFLNVVPVITVITSYFVFNETISFEQIIGGILVIISVYLVNAKEKESSQEVAEEQA